MTIYERIKHLANEKNISIRELESQLGFSNGLLRSWKNSTNSASLEKVANYFDVTTDYLLGRENETIFKSSDVLALLECAFLTFDGKPLSKKDRDVVRGLAGVYLTSKD